MTLFEVITPGAFTTVQDLGRYGFQKMGLPICGALDSYAFRLANLMVGNPDNCAMLEITVMGPRLKFLAKADIAVTGAEMSMTLNEAPVTGWQSLRVKQDDILEIHQIKTGCRAYLAVSGGIDVPVVMGSRCTYVGGKIGGFKGRPLQAGDLIESNPARLLKSPKQLPQKYTPHYPTEITLCAIPGPQDNFFRKGLDVLFESAFMVTAKADRMGYRLQGPSISVREDMPKSIISEPTMPGGIQIPADQQPIILLVEQTVGGYNKIATVISSDLPKVAQATPGDTIHFEKITLEKAHAAFKDAQKQLGEIAENIARQ